MKTIFLDESGKTGTQRYTGKWNFANQPYFTLCGVIIPNENLNELKTSMAKLCSKFQVQGGELKSTKKAVRNHLDEITTQIWNMQEQLNCKLLIEIVNKRYCIAMMINDYCVFPYYDTPIEYHLSPKSVLVKRCFANYIYDFISDDLLGEYVNFFDCGSQNIQRLKELCLNLIEESKNEIIKKFITETIDSFMNFKNLGLLKHHVFPLLDYYKGGISSVAVCPHINSFNNIITQIGDLDNFVVIHDNISDLEEALKKDVNDLLNIKRPEFLSFANSKDIEGLQLADFWCGYIRESVQQFLINGNKVPPILSDLVNNNNVNFVGTFDEQAKLFPKDRCVVLFQELYKDFLKNESLNLF